MRPQRCVWHGKRDFPFILYQDGAKKEEQQPFHALIKEIMLFSLTKEMLEEVLPPDKELVVDLIEEIKRVFEKLIKALDPVLIQSKKPASTSLLSTNGSKFVKSGPTISGRASFSSSIIRLYES